jgi:lariat debranching enzyme
MHFCHRYYTRAKVAPVLTLVIGGNHEASNYMWELYVVCLSLVVFLGLLLGRFYGGWIAPNIFFVGNAGCVQVNGIRIAGMSGIFNRNHYRQGNNFSSRPERMVKPTPRFL